MRQVLLPGNLRLSWEVEQYPDGWHAIRWTERPTTGPSAGDPSLGGPETTPRRLGVYGTAAEAEVACDRDQWGAMDEWMGTASPTGGGGYYHETPKGYVP